MEPELGRVATCLHLNYKLLVLQSKFIFKRVQNFIHAITIFESDLACSFILNDFIKTIEMDMFNQGANIQESIAEVLSEMTETFTVDEQGNISKETGDASQCVNAKFSEYFDQEDGIYSSFNFMNDSASFYHTVSLGFEETVRLNNIQGFNLVSLEDRTYKGLEKLYIKI